MSAVVERRRRCPRPRAISKAASARPPSDRSVAARDAVRGWRGGTRPFRRSAARSTGGASPSSRPKTSARRADWPRWPGVAPISSARSPSRGRPAIRSAARRDQPHRADGRRGQDRLAVGLVVEPDVARHDRHVERRAGRADALDRADELAHDLGLLGVAEVEVVGGGQRRGADGDEVAVGLGHRLLAALDRVGLDVARRHVRGEGQRLAGAVHPHDAGAEAGRAHGVGHDLVVVLLADPGLRGVVGRADQRLQRRRSGRSSGAAAKRRGGGGLDPGAVVFRRRRRTASTAAGRPSPRCRAG